MCYETDTTNFSSCIGVSLGSVIRAILNKLIKMALEFICSDDIIKGKKINIPEGAEVCRAKSSMIKFFKNSSEIKNGFISIPMKAKKLSFENLEIHAYNTEYGAPIFYDHKGNVLK